MVVIVVVVIWMVIVVHLMTIVVVVVVAVCTQRTARRNIGRRRWRRIVDGLLWVAFVRVRSRDLYDKMGRESYTNEFWCYEIDPHEQKNVFFNSTQQNNEKSTRNSPECFLWSMILLNLSCWNSCVHRPHYSHQRSVTAPVKSTPFSPYQ